MVWAGVGAGVWAGAGAPLCPHVHKEVLPKRNPKNPKEQRIKNERENKPRYFFGGIQCTWHLFGGTFSAISSIVPFGRYPVLAVPFGRYRELVELRVVTFLAEAVKPKYGGIVSAVMQHGGNVLAVGGITKTW